jgi:hypothetical protein
MLFRHQLAKLRSGTQHSKFLIRHQLLLVTEPGFQGLTQMGYRFMIPSSGSTSFGEIAAGGDELPARADLGDFKSTGFWGIRLGLDPDDSPFILRDRYPGNVFKEINQLTAAPVTLSVSGSRLARRASQRTSQYGC